MKALKMIAIIAGLVVTIVVLTVAGVSYYARFNLLALDDQARKRAPGQFVKLSDGQVHYQWHGPENGDVTVLVHGFSTPSFVWRGLLAPLTSTGLRVLTYDNYGRGWSDRPALDNDAALFDRQLVELLDSLGVTAPFNLLGYSMGGAIAVNYLALRPGAAKRLALIAPAGFPDPGGTMAKLLNLVNLPVIVDWLMAGAGMSRRVNRRTAILDMVERYIEQIAYKGYLRSLISTVRHFPLYGMQAQFEQVGRQSLPVSVIWGDLDAIVPYANAAKVKRAIPQLQLTTIKGGRHAIPYTEAELVAAVLAPFFTAAPEE
jgi:pimeloyl-ACP methyl ester carboxylesterase